jgi:LacI family transcriptional regulator
VAVTMADVARASGVSTSTVSHVINGTRYVDPATLERVRGVIDELGYRHNHLARSVARGGRTQSIGVAMSARSNPYFGAVVSAIDDAAAGHGSTILLGETADDHVRELRLLDSLLQRRVDGIIFAPGPEAGREALPLLAKSATPTVLIDRMPPDSGFDQIGTDNVEPTACLVEHLARAHGHRRIGFVAGMPGLSTTAERLTGYRLGLARCGLEPQPELVTAGASSRRGGEAAMAQLLALPDPPSAVIAGNNAMTVGTLRTLSARGVRVPDGVAVAGFDDFDWAGLLASPLTSVAQDWDTIGARAVEILIRRLDASHEPPVIERVPTTLHIRNSCGCTGVAEPIPIAVAATTTT